MERRAVWHEQVVKGGFRRLIFVDESGANTRMTRWRGRALHGQRLRAGVPHGHYHTCSLIAGICPEGPLAPCLFEGAIDGPMFLAWVREGLSACLRPGDLLIMDNLSTHKVSGVLEAVESTGAKLWYLPPYSPDFNPIENMWSKIKQCLRSLAPRTLEELLPATKTAFDAISTADCIGFFSNAKYAT
jgi:transposase